MIKKAWFWAVKHSQFAGLAMLLIALPFKNFWVSFASFWILGSFIAEVITLAALKQPLKHRFTAFLKNRHALLLTSIYFLLLIGLLWTSEFKHAIWDLNIKLPFLFMPFLLCALKPISRNALNALYVIFLASLLCAVAICLMVYWRLVANDYVDIREISIFISHIRFSLLLSLGVCICVFVLLKEKFFRLFAMVCLLAFVYFMWVIESVTGFSVLLGVAVWWVLYRVLSSRVVWLRIAFSVVLVVMVSSVCFYVVNSYRDYFKAEKVDFNNLDELSEAGNPYEHHLNNLQLENGHYVWLYVQPQELRSEWEKRSRISTDSVDAKGEMLFGTLIRYMASLGLRKDSSGVTKLSAHDFKNIEAGITNGVQLERSGIDSRVDKILFEYDVYRNGGNPSGYSVLQRLEFWKAACGIIEKNIWLGTGTGDVKEAYRTEYELMSSKLDEKHRLRAHNQYLTFFVTYGIFGLLWFLFVLLFPIIFLRLWRNALYMSFFVIISLSFLTEDTLETQTGVTLFVFFTCFFTLLHVEDNSDSKGNVTHPVVV